MIYLCIINQKREVLEHRPLKNENVKSFTKIMSPYIGKIAIAAEACFPYYWLADLCNEIGVDFLLGHALYMKHIHGGKAKNDRIDSKKIAMLTINHMLPFAYSYPTENVHLRDLLRRRLYFVHKNSELKTHLKLQAYQTNLPIPGKITKSKIRDGSIASRFKNDDQRMSAQMNLDSTDFYQNIIAKIENYALEQMKGINPKQMSIVRSMQGIGPVIGMTIVLEIGDISRFANHKAFASYCRLIKCSHESAGKKLGYGGAKIGNPHLKNAFSMAAVLVQKYYPEVKSYLDKLELKHGKGRSLSIMAHKIGRTIYYMLKNEKVFDINKFFKGS
jgi:transposase